MPAILPQVWFKIFNSMQNIATDVLMSAGSAFALSEPAAEKPFTLVGLAERGSLTREQNE